MVYTIKLTSYANCHSDVDNVLNHNIIMKLLVQNIILDYYPSKKKD